MRLFIAIEFDKKMKDAIAKVQNLLKARGFRGSFTRYENLHLTLAFLGDYPDPDFVLETMSRVLFEPFPLVLSGLGNFGDLWWVGIRQSDPLSSYVRRLRHTLAEAAIPFDRKKFSPHITILRRASFILPPEIVIPEISMTASNVTLFRSDRGKNGMLYTALGSIS